MLPEPLRTGDYELYEVAAPYGYVLSSEPVPFTIDGQRGRCHGYTVQYAAEGAAYHHQDRRGIRFRPGE